MADILQTAFSKAFRDSLYFDKKNNLKFVLRCPVDNKQTWKLCLSHIQPRAPYDFYHPYDFLPVRPRDAPVGILRHCCSRGHIRLRAPYGLTQLMYAYGLVEWFAGLHGYPVWCPYRHRASPARESSMFFISYGTRTGPVRDPQGHRTTPLRTCKGIDTTKTDKNPAQASYLAVWGPYGPLMVPAWAVHGLFNISKPVRGL